MDNTKTQKLAEYGRDGQMETYRIVHYRENGDIDDVVDEFGTDSLSSAQIIAEDYGDHHPDDEDWYLIDSDGDNCF